MQNVQPGKAVWIIIGNYCGFSDSAYQKSIMKPESQGIALGWNNIEVLKSRKENNILTLTLHASAFEHHV